MAKIGTKSIWRKESKPEDGVFLIPAIVIGIWGNSYTFPFSLIANRATSHKDGKDRTKMNLPNVVDPHHVGTNEMQKYRNYPLL